MVCAHRLARSTLLLCVPTEEPAVRLSAEEAAPVLLALLDVTLAALSVCWGLHWAPGEAIALHEVKVAAENACKALELIMTDNDGLEVHVAAGLVEEGRLLRWFGCLEGLEVGVAVDIMSLLVAGITAERPADEGATPGSTDLSPSHAAEVRLHCCGNEGRVLACWHWALDDKVLLGAVLLVLRS
jgi:hypothetical protein